MSGAGFAGGLPPVEAHPFEPFLPDCCRLLMLGSFPPAERRWSMRFYYPNFSNDMWRIFGLCFFADASRLVDVSARTFRLDDIVALLRLKGIGMYDTACAVRRLRNTASDKDLEVVRPTDLAAMLASLPCCRAVVTTGQKATDVVCSAFGIGKPPAVGKWVEFGTGGRSLRLYRMPSSSRAYPLRLEAKAAFYKPMFEAEVGCGAGRPLG